MKHKFNGLSFRYRMNCTNVTHTPQMCIRVRCNGIEYDSIRSCAKDIGISEVVVGQISKGIKFRKYKDYIIERI